MKNPELSPGNFLEGVASRSDRVFYGKSADFAQRADVVFGTSVSRRIGVCGRDGFFVDYDDNCQDLEDGDTFAYLGDYLFAKRREVIRQMPVAEESDGVKKILTGIREAIHKPPVDPRVAYLDGLIDEFHDIKSHAQFLAYYFAEMKKCSTYAEGESIYKKMMEDEGFRSVSGEFFRNWFFKCNSIGTRKNVLEAMVNSASYVSVGSAFFDPLIECGRDVMDVIDVLDCMGKMGVDPNNFSFEKIIATGVISSKDGYWKFHETYITLLAQHSGACNGRWGLCLSLQLNGYCTRVFGRPLV